VPAKFMWLVETDNANILVIIIYLLYNLF